jgi:periplasmic protein TonB
MKKVLIASLLFVTQCAFSQITKRYFNNDDKEVANPSFARMYKLFDQRDSLLTITAYDLNDNKLSEYNFRSRVEKGSKDTIDIYYGPFKIWGKDGILWEQGQYYEDKMHGEQIYYYSNGQIQRSTILEHGVFKSGKCFDYDGNEVEYYHTIVDEQPEFPAGQAALFQFLSQKIKYPMKARKNGIEGTVYVGFIVNAIGDIVEVALKRGIHPSIDNEALRVVAMMPRWKPGKLNGLAVRVAYTVPIKFALE